MISDICESQAGPISGSEATAASIGNVSPTAIADTQKTIPPILLFVVPPSDTQFHRLGPELCQETWLTLARLKQIHFAKNKTREAERIAATLQRVGNRRGCSPRNLKELYYCYTSRGKTVGGISYPAGDWRCVVNWAKAGSRARAGSVARAASDVLPSDFIQKVFLRLCDRHQRVISEAIRELLQIWKTGFDSRGDRWKEIPGYAEWPKPESRTGRPLGWTDRNLYRYIDAFTKTAARQGIQAASQIGLKIPKTRVGVKLLEIVQTDDHEFDFKIIFPGQMRPMRPRCFGAADLLTSRCFNLVAKPTFWDQADEAKRALTETDFMWFQIANLTEFGFRTDTGTVFHVEHGTSAIRGDKTRPITDPLRDDLEKRFYDATAGKVTFHRSGRFHKAAHGGQFAPPSGGNPRFKLIIEGYWRIINDRLDSLPGQVGKDRFHAPEELERADAYVEKLLKAAVALQPDKAAQLIIPRLTWDQFLEHLWAKLAAIDDEQNHSIEGWEKCKFVIKEFRETAESLDWKPLSALSALSAVNPSAAVAVYKSDDCNRVRRLSRLEAWQSLYSRELEAGLITRLRPESIPSIVGKINALRCNGRDSHPVRDGVFTIEDSKIDSDPLRFLAVDHLGDRLLPGQRVLRLREGERYVCYLNPLSPNRLIVCNAKHQVISVCPLMPKPAANDRPGILASVGLQRSWQSRALAPVRERNQPDAAALDFMRRHNAAILGPKPTTKIPTPAPQIADDCTEELLQREAALLENNQ